MLSFKNGDKDPYFKRAVRVKWGVPCRVKVPRACLGVQGLAGAHDGLISVF